jgi:hypothetical protein
MVQSSDSKDLNSKEGAFIFRDMPEGTKVKLNDGAIVEVTGNPRDGAWIQARYVEHPSEPSKVGEEEMIFFMDVASLA